MQQLDYRITGLGRASQPFAQKRNRSPKSFEGQLLIVRASLDEASSDAACFQVVPSLRHRRIIVAGERV